MYEINLRYSARLGQRKCTAQKKAEESVWGKVHDLAFENTS